MQPHFSFGFHSKGSEDALADVAVQCGISQAKMAVQSNIVKRGKQKFDDTGIIKKVGDGNGQRRWLVGRRFLCF